MSDQERSSAIDELESMKTIDEALQKLEPESVRRVLSWVLDRYKIQSPAVGSTRSFGSQQTSQSSEKPSSGRISEFNDLPEFYSAINPKTDTDKALVIGYWFNEIEQSGDFDSFSINQELKRLGYPVGNITRAFDNLKKRKPQLVMQVQKSGTSRQARKKFRLTEAGKNAVRNMMTKNQEDYDQ